MTPYSHLLTPREVAAMFGVRTSTLARWAREGRLGATLTPGGHRRYDPDDVRLYREGWSIRRVAAEFGMTYGAMRHLLRAHVTLRNRGGAYAPLEDDTEPGRVPGTDWRGQLEPGCFDD